jgi:endonuclease I
MRFNFIWIYFFVFCSGFLLAQPPAGYYTTSTLDGKNTTQLRTAFKNILTSGHSVLSYDNLWNAYDETDLKANGKIWDVYSNCVFTFDFDQCGPTIENECDCYNREHTVPASWFNDATPMYSDLYNVYPTDGKVNQVRSNYPYGEVNTATYTSNNGSKLGANVFVGYSGTVFEPADEYKGDLARTYFYMATRYADICANWGNGVFGTQNLGLTDYAMNLFLDWSRNDPVSAKEIARNNAVYLKQNNRNPFIDFPELEEYIWGNMTNQLFYVNGPPIVLATITNTTSSSITINSATLSAAISNAGGGTISQLGFYYSTVDGFANGSGTLLSTTPINTGTFTANLTNLSSNFTYYFKSFATNQAGTSYSSQQSFTTLFNTAAVEPLVVNVISAGSQLNFGSVSTTATKQINIKTSNITGTLTVTVSGTGFSTNVSQISVNEANNGKIVPIVFTPTNSGTYSGTLSITGGGLANYSVQLQGVKN